MNLKDLFKRKATIIVAIVLLMFLAFGLYWNHKLFIAHSTFENFYNFRGCTELITKTDTYGLCKVSSGQTIKIVKYQNKWYLDGDLPCLLCI